MSPKLIESRFAVKACPKCGKPIEQGAQVWYDSDGERGRKSWHKDCGEGKPEAKQQPAPAPAPIKPADPAAPMVDLDLDGLRAHAAPAWAPRALPVELRTHKHGRAEIWRYASFEDFISDAYLDGQQPRIADNERAVNYWGGRAGGEVGHSRDWLGLDGAGELKVDEIIATCRHWPKGAETIQTLSDELMTDLPRPRSIARRRTRADFGDALDITQVWRGNLGQAWERCHREQAPKTRRVIIGVDQLEFGCNDATRIFWRGAAALTLADIMTAAGYSVEMRACFLGGNHCGAQGVSVIVKDSDKPLDIMALAGGMAHPATFRAIGHSWLMMFARSRRGGGGVSVYDWQAIPDGERIVPQSVGTRAEARAWILAQVAEIQGDTGAGELRLAA